MIADRYFLNKNERKELISHLESENLSYIPFPQCDGLGKAGSTTFRDWLEDLEKIGGKNNNLSSSISTIAWSSHSLNKSAESGDFPDDIKVIETSFFGGWREEKEIKFFIGD